MIYKAIDRWNSPDSYLEHHGVKGMKWGVRKSYHNFQANRHRKAVARIQKDIDSFKGHENGIQTKDGRQLLTSKDVNDSIKGLKTVQKRHLEKAKQHESWDPSAKERQRIESMAPGARKRYLAKKEYKAAKKEYNKAFNKYYYSNPLNAFTSSGRQKTWSRYQNALVKAGDLGIARGKYIQAKGLAKSNPKQVNKGKHLVEIATNTRKYNSILLKDIQNGYTYNEAVSRNRGTRENLVKKQQDIDAKYRRMKY